MLNYIKNRIRREKLKLSLINDLRLDYSNGGVDTGYNEEE